MGALKDAAASDAEARDTIAPRRTAMAAKPVPDGYYTVTPYLIVKGAAQALEFYKKAFDAKELYRLDAPGGKIGHAEMQIGNSRVMLADEHPEVGAVAPTGSGHPVSFLLYVDDVDRWFPRALSAGAKQIRPVTDQFYGDRSGVLVDPFGHCWSIATHKEDVTPEQMEQRAKAGGKCG
jgi:PhnB protein